MLSKKCKLHLEEVGETGFQHLVKALKIALRLQLLVSCSVHAFAPRFFTKTATNTIKEILDGRI